MGIRLTVACANRRYLLFQTGIRMGFCLLALIGLCVSIARPPVSPARWLTAMGVWLVLFLLLLCWAIAPLRLLTRSFECYENGIEVFDRTHPLDRVERFVWRRRPLRLLGVIPTDTSYLSLTCYLLPEEGAKRGKSYRYSDLMFSALYERFEEAYEHSLPCEYQLTLPPKKTKRTSLHFPFRGTDSTE